MDPMLEAKRVIELLPEVIRKNPAIKYKIYEILEEKFPSREETNKILEEIKKLREDMNKRFEAVDRKFEEMREEMDIEMREDLKDHRDFVNMVVGGFQIRAGKNLENMVAGTLRFALERKDIIPANIKLRQKVIDNEGMIGIKNRKYEYDIFISNKEQIIFDINPTPDKEDIERFADKCMLVIKKLNLKKAEKVLVTLDKRKEIIEACEEYGITLV
jgi:hypothetical protein